MLLSTKYSNKRNVLHLLQPRARNTPDGQLLDEKAEEPEEGDVTPLTIIVELTKAEANEFLAQPKYALANTLADFSDDRRRIARRILKAHGFST